MFWLHLYTVYKSTPGVMSECGSLSSAVFAVLGGLGLYSLPGIHETSFLSVLTQTAETYKGTLKSLSDDVFAFIWFLGKMKS